MREQDETTAYWLAQDVMEYFNIDDPGAAEEFMQRFNITVKDSLQYEGNAEYLDHMTGVIFDGKSEA